MAKKNTTPSKDVKTKPKKTSEKRVNKIVYTKDIYITNFHFKKIHDKQKIMVKDVLVTISSEMTPEQINVVLHDVYYNVKALRIYFKSEGRVFNQADALDKYEPVKIDFVRRIGVSFAS